MKQRKPIVVSLLVVLAVGVVGVPLVLGSRLPPEHDTRVTTRVRGEREAVYSAIADVHSWPSWMPGYGPIRPAPAHGTHPVFESPADEHTVIRYELARLDPPSHVRIAVDSSNHRLSATWDFEIGGFPGGTEVTVRERARTDSPMLRFVMRYLTGYEAGIRGIARALERRFGALDTPRTP